MLAPRSVALAFGPDAAALDLAGPMDVFSAATAMLGEGAGYRLLLVSPQDGPVRLSNGSRMLPDLRCADANERYDVVLAAGGPTPAHDSALSGWLRRACPRARVHGSICTGAFALGHAGLLDGHTVTTHWEFADELATRFPAARVEPDRIHAQRRADHLGRRNRRHRPGPGAGGRGPWRGTGAAHRAEAGGGGPAARRAIAVQPLPERATGSGHADRAGTGPCDGTRRRRLQRGQAGRHRRHERSQLRAPFHAGRRHHAARIHRARASMPRAACSKAAASRSRPSPTTADSATRTICGACSSDGCASRPPTTGRASTATPETRQQRASGGPDARLRVAPARRAALLSSKRSTMARICAAACSICRSSAAPASSARPSRHSAISAICSSWAC